MSRPLPLPYDGTGRLATRHWQRILLPIGWSVTWCGQDVRPDELADTPEAVTCGLCQMRGRPGNGGGLG